MQTGPRNAITDVPGLRVGNATNPDFKTGATVLVGNAPFTAGVSVMGGAPGSCETDLLQPENTVQEVDALVLSGGSAFGLQAAAGVMDTLAAMGRGYAVGPARVPIVPGAVIFDLLAGGDMDWGVSPPHYGLGMAALQAASSTFEIGTAGAGTGATTATLKGGLGTASTVLADGTTIGALVAVNARGSAIMGDGPHFWAAPFELEDEFGGLGPGPYVPAQVYPPPHKDLTGAGQSGARDNTTIAIVATDLALDKAQTTRLAIAAQDGLARAIWPAHTPIDGDLVFAAATGDREMTAPLEQLSFAGAIAAATLSRAIARAVYAASPATGDILPTWQERFGRSQ